MSIDVRKKNYFGIPHIIDDSTSPYFFWMAQARRVLVGCVEKGGKLNNLGSSVSPLIDFPTIFVHGIPPTVLFRKARYYYITVLFIIAKLSNMIIIHHHHDSNSRCDCVGIYVKPMEGNAFKDFI